MISVPTVSSVKTSICADGPEALFGGGQTEKSGLLKICEASRFNEEQASLAFTVIRCRLKLNLNRCAETLPGAKRRFHDGHRPQL
jgi:hypothetical protein